MSSKTVLVVDDSSLARMMMKNVFGQAFPDWKIVEAKDGNDGFAQAALHVVDLALIDYNMPGMNGIDLAAKLQELNKEMRIYLVTANVQEKMRQRADAMGVGFIMKPINKDKLAQAMAGKGSK
ncbi:MAG: response regulator [Magnetococcales bacterium]|nr:response regulator [Magnetococcales bacterium]MBF0321382.1 response regulator [Magnetococcales bacterium]